MKHYEEQKFNISDLKGISTKNIEEHLKLYSGYVKNTNLILDKIEELSVDLEKNSYILGELQRRFGFEFDGMRNHEYYFRNFENGPKELSDESALKKTIETDFGDFDKWLAHFKAIATTRGLGWVILYYDQYAKRLLNSWIDEQHLGQLVGAQPILVLDMWEHAFIFDYQPSGKKQYVEDFFSNLNWEVVEKNFLNAQQ
ncbi:MAG: Fe-Mn family superoxide dismutase [Candidatus Paceibacterota bacterium]